MNLLQDILGLLSRNKKTKPVDTDLIPIGRYASIKEVLKPNPSLHTSLVSIKELKNHIAASININTNTNLSEFINDVGFITTETDSQTLSLLGNDLTISNGNTVTLPDPDLSSVIPIEVIYTVDGGTSGTQPTFNGTPLFEGSYVLTGPLVFFRVNVDMTNILTFGTGQYYLTVPFTSKYDTIITAGHLHDNSTGNEYILSGELEAGSNILKLYYAAGNSQLEIFDFNSPKPLEPVDFFHISGNYIKE
jgi:hypothetical protein